MKKVLKIINVIAAACILIMAVAVPLVQFDDGNHSMSFLDTFSWLEETPGYPVVYGVSVILPAVCALIMAVLHALLGSKHKTALVSSAMSGICMMASLIMVFILLISYLKGMDYYGEPSVSLLFWLMCAMYAVSVACGVLEFIIKDNVNSDSKNTNESSQQYSQQMPQQYSQQYSQQFSQQPSQQYSQQLSQQPSQQYSQQYSQQMSQQYSQEIPQQYSQQMSQQYSQQMPQQYSQEIPQQYSQQMSQQYSQEIPQQYSQQPSQQYSQQLSQQYSQEIPQQYSQQMSQQPSQQYSQQLSQQPSQQYSQQMSQQMSQQYSQQMSQQYSQQISQQNSQNMEQQPLRPVIRCESGDYAGAEFPCDGKLIIGSDPQLANVVISGDKISGDHCTVSYVSETDSYLVVDGSLHGVVAEPPGMRLPAHISVSLPRGTVISIGSGADRFMLV